MWCSRSSDGGGWRRSLSEAPAAPGRTPSGASPRLHHQPPIGFVTCWGRRRFFGACTHPHQYAPTENTVPTPSARSCESRAPGAERAEAGERKGGARSEGRESIVCRLRVSASQPHPRQTKTPRPRRSRHGRGSTSRHGGRSLQSGQLERELLEPTAALDEHFDGALQVGQTFA